MFIIAVLLLIGAILQRHAAVSHINIFSIQNIVEVVLISIIGILIAILAKKIFKDKFDTPLNMLLKLLKKKFSKKKR